MPYFTEEELEDLYYYEDADTQTYNSDSEDEIDDDCVDVMCETDMIQNIKFEEETKEKYLAKF